MRISKLILGVATLAAMGCSGSNSSSSSSSSSSTTTSGSGSSSSTTSTTSSTTSSSSSSTSAGNGSGSSSISSTGGSGSSGSTGTTGPACAPSASCTAVDKTCLGLVDNTGKTKFGLRMSELDLSAPAALTRGIVSNTITGSVAPNLASCREDGNATFSWLIQLNTQAQTLETGGAKPVSDPTQGYSFDTDTVQGLSLAPATFASVVPSSQGSFSVTMGQDLNMPIFLDAAGTNVIILPMHQVRIRNAMLSSNNNCIGSYNAAGLDPANSCLPDSTHPQFIAGGSVDGFITLEEADAVVISAVQQSLCVLLSGNATMYGTVPSGSSVAVCKRDSSGNILYQGGWCSTTNAPAGNGCADAEQLNGNFAASSVTIN